MPRAKKRGSKFAGELVRPIEEKKVIWALDKSKWEEAAARECAESTRMLAQKGQATGKARWPHSGRPATSRSSSMLRGSLRRTSQLICPAFRSKSSGYANTHTAIEVHYWQKKNKKPSNQLPLRLSLAKHMLHPKIGTVKIDRQAKEASILLPRFGLLSGHQQASGSISTTSLELEAPLSAEKSAFMKRGLSFSVKDLLAARRVTKRCTAVRRN